MRGRCRCRAKGVTIRIGLTPGDLLAWQGGREFFRLVAISLRSSLQPGDRLTIVSPRLRDGLGFRLARVAKRAMLRQASSTWVRDELVRRSQRRVLQTLLGGGFALADESGSAVDVVGPTAPETAGSAAWLGFVPDVQHRRLPEMFSTAERDLRDVHFRHVLGHANAVIVNAQAVRDDLMEFYPDLPCPITVLPFAPVPEADWLTADQDVSARYGVTPPYFICSNQFWRHKNHRVVFEAIALAKAAGGNIRFVFTNATADYRHPGYFEELIAEIAQLGIGDRVHILGLIPKLDQIRLMRRAVAVVQPSLFEGGPGGGSIYNAISLGLPTLVSDIPVNREIADFVTAYFNPLDADDLARKLMTMATQAHVHASARDLMEAGDQRLLAFGQALREAFGVAAKRSYPA